MVEVEVPVFPPERHLEPCEGTPVRRIDDVIRELSTVIDCERASKAALRAWIAERRND